MKIDIENTKSGVAIGVRHMDCNSSEELHDKLMNYGGKYADTKEKIGDNFFISMQHVE